MGKEKLAQWVGDGFPCARGNGRGARERRGGGGFNGGDGSEGGDGFPCARGNGEGGERRGKEGDWGRGGRAPARDAPTGEGRGKGGDWGASGTTGGEREGEGWVSVCAQVAREGGWAPACARTTGGGDSYFLVVESKGGFGEGAGMGFFMGRW